MNLASLLTAPLFSLWDQPVSGLELIGFSTGLGAVWLTYRLHIANWPLGMVSVAIYGWLFFHARLYADALLQLAFLVLCIYGWRAWAQGQRGQGFMPVTRMRLREAALLAACAGAAIGLIACVLIAYTDSPAPFLDAAIFSLSLAATWAQARARLECWWLWIAVDLISIPLYWTRGLPLTAILYLLFLLICLRGLAAWRLQLQKAPA